LIALIVGVGENADGENMQVTFANPLREGIAATAAVSEKLTEKWISINHCNSINRESNSGNSTFLLVLVMDETRLLTDTALSPRLRTVQ
jgi:hypothetical protein